MITICDGNAYVVDDRPSLGNAIPKVEFRQTIEEAVKRFDYIALRFRQYQVGKILGNYLQISKFSGSIVDNYIQEPWAHNFEFCFSNSEQTVRDFIEYDQGLLDGRYKPTTTTTRT